MTPHDLFQKDKALFEKLSAVVHSDWFAQAMLYARSAFLESLPSSEQIKGAQALENALVSLCADPEDKVPTLTTGLIHNIDNPREEIAAKKTT